MKFEDAKLEILSSLEKIREDSFSGKFHIELDMTNGGVGALSCFRLVPYKERADLVCYKPKLFMKVNI